MNCRQIKDRLSEYIDKELDEAVEKQVADHIKACSSCRELEEFLRNTVIKPLRNAETLKAPQTIWEAVERRIVEEQPLSLTERIRSWFDIVLSPVPAQAGAAIIILLLGVSSLLWQPRKSQNLIHSYVANQLQFFAQLEKTGEQDTLTTTTTTPQVDTTGKQPPPQTGQEETFLKLDNVNLGTTIEQFFL